MCRDVLFTAFYALLSPNNLFWISLFLDSNWSDNPGKHTIHDKILDKVNEMGKGQKVEVK